MTHHEMMPKMEHVELASKNPEATQKFLEKAFGWKFAVMGPEMGNYRMHGREQQAAAGTVGVRPLMDPKEQPGSIAYITVTNIDAAIKNVEAAGAKIIMPKTEIPGMGWSAVYHAPGDVLGGLYQTK